MGAGQQFNYKSKLLVELGGASKSEENNSKKEESSLCTETEEDLVDDLPSNSTFRTPPTSSHRLLHPSTSQIEPQSCKVQSGSKLAQLGKWL